MESVRCTECQKLISKGNISRHRKSHGVLPCQKCIHVSFESEAQILGMRFWFQSFQIRLKACDILDRMVQIRDVDSIEDLEKIPMFYLKAIYEAALLDIGCKWSRQTLISKNMWRLIRCRVYEKQTIR